VGTVKARHMVLAYGAVSSRPILHRHYVFCLFSPSFVKLERPWPLHTLSDSGACAVALDVIMLFIATEL
jgi:hypothetical protein